MGSVRARDRVLVQPVGVLFGLSDDVGATTATVAQPSDLFGASAESIISFEAVVLSSVDSGTPGTASNSAGLISTVLSGGHPSSASEMFQLPEN